MAFFVADAEIGVMIFAVRYPGHGIDEGHGLVIIFKLESFTYDAVILHPAVELFDQAVDLVLPQRWNTSFAGRAFFAGQFRESIHGMLT